MDRSPLKRSRAAAVAAAIALLTMVTAIIGASPARAAFCDGTTTAIVILRFEDTGPITIGVEDNQLMLNGEVCAPDSGSVTSVAIVDINTPDRVDEIVIDLTEPMRVDGQPIPVNLFDNNGTEAGPNQVTIIGSASADNVIVEPSTLVVLSPTDFAPNDDVKLTLGFADDDIDLDIQLGGGADSLISSSLGGSFFDGQLTVHGGSGPDTITGGPFDDVLSGGGGADTISGMGGDDDIEGGKGRDELAGGGGEDEIDGNGGADILRGGSGDDELRGGNGPDRVKGGSDDDNLSGNKGADVLRGGSGNDVIVGGNGLDKLFGGSGGDLFSTDGDGKTDIVRGGKGINDACSQCGDEDDVRASVEIQ